MTLTTVGIAANVLPAMTKTMFQHFYTQLKKSEEDKHTEATDEFLFHEALTLLQEFMKMASHDTVEAIQKFTNTHTPYQPWSTVLPCVIPMSSCNEAAKVVIDYFGPEDLKNIVGGSKWWQIRGLEGIEAEWIAMSNDYRDAKKAETWAKKEGKKEEDIDAKLAKGKAHAKHQRPDLKKKSSRKSVQEQAAEAAEIEAENYESINRLKRTMLYIHGGAYYLGSINTHRFKLVRFARKFGGRVFACNYRKAPGYPWPCPIQDCLAAYLYLIQPPPGAKHKAVDPKDIVISGDSAGGAMALALMTVIRDMNLPAPAGGVLLSPWCDMTHSFPSILQNTSTDYIPPYGFVHKPSTLWPVPAVPDSDADPAKPKKRFSFKSAPPSPELGVPTGVSGGEDAAVGVGPSKGGADGTPAPTATHTVPPKQPKGVDEDGIPYAPKHLPAEIIRVPLSGEEKEFKMRAQIQLYATNEQLFHPLCSPVLQGSLGGLPPLYIYAGDSEVLRDEIVHLAHRAAKPSQYPLSQELLDRNPRSQKVADRFNHIPTKVHLQVYDEQPHVLTMFAFTTSARFAYRAIASFVKHVTGAPTTVIDPVSGQPEVEVGSPIPPNVAEEPHNEEAQPTAPTEKPVKPTIQTAHLGQAGDFNDSPAGMTPVTAAAAKDSPIIDGPMTKRETKAKRRRNATLGSDNFYSGMVPLKRPTFSVTHMLRERVNLRGDVRPLEAEELLQACRTTGIGTIKEGPVKRYVEGCGIWDKKFAKTAKRVEKRRAKNEIKARQLLKRGAEMGLLGAKPPPRDDEITSTREWSDYVAIGPLDVAEETPPPTALAGRRDTEDALQLMRIQLNQRAKEAGVRIGKRQRVKDALFTDSPKQISAETQVDDKGNAAGLTVWSGFMSGLRIRPHRAADERPANERRKSSSHSVKKLSLQPAREDNESVDDAEGAATYDRREWTDSAGATSATTSTTLNEATTTTTTS